MPKREQAFDEGFTNESGSTGDKYVHQLLRCGEHLFIMPAHLGAGYRRDNVVVRSLIPLAAVFLLGLGLSGCRLPVSERLEHTGGEVSNYNFTLDYEVWLPQGYDESPERTYPLLVWFHGGGDNELSWGREGKIGEIVQDRVTKGELQPFIVVSPSAGTFTPVFRTYERLLLENVLPDVKQRYRTNGEIVAFGHSMGGLSALMVTLRHPDLFDATVAASPFGFDSTPWDTPEQKQAYGEKYGDTFLRQYRYQLEKNFNSREEYDEWAPFSLVRRDGMERPKNLLLTIGDKDPLGLYPHVKLLHDVMLENGVEHEWYVQEGVGHGTVEDPRLMDWLSEHVTDGSK